MSTGVVKWVLGSYSITLSATGDIVHSITHVCTGTVADVSPHKIAADYELQDNWLDMSASLSKPPFPSMRLHVFFAKGQGPHSFTCFNSKSKLFESFCEDVAVK